MLKKGLTRNLLIFLGYLIDEIDANTYSAQMQRLRNQGWYQRSTVQSTISRLLSVGDIEKTIKKGKIYYRLTSKGSDKIKEDIPLLRLSEKPWDGKWRMVIFDIKEKYRPLREGLRRKLLSLGFGMWQKSIYISPFDIAQEVNQYLVSQKLFPYAICLIAKRSEIGDDKILANYIWKLDKLNEDYEEFISKCKTGNFQKLWFGYQELILRDPHLPKELLPSDWLRDKARITLAQLLQNR